MPHKRAKLNSTERTAYNCIHDFQDRYQTRPTYQRIADGVGCSYAMAKQLMLQLAAKGWLEIAYSDDGYPVLTEPFKLKGE